MSHLVPLCKGGLNFKDKENSAMLSQIRTIDAKRLSYKIGSLEKSVFENLEKAFVEFFKLTSP